LTWSASTIQQRKFDGLRLLQQVPAITELAQLDASGKEQLRVSRLARDLGTEHPDYSHDPRAALNSTCSHMR
jgi:two-component system, NtrC family, sensor kinase